MPRLPVDNTASALAALTNLSDSLRTLAARGVPKQFRKGERVIQEGRPGDEIYIILTGRLRAFSENDKGREITYGVYGPGEYLGEMSLDGGLRSASVIAMEASQCAMVTRQTLLAQIKERPEFALELMAKVIRRARAATLSARELALNDAYGRLKRLLESSAVRDAEGQFVLSELPSHRELAGHLGCSREMVSRLMKDLGIGGYLDPHGPAIKFRALPVRW